MKKSVSVCKKSFALFVVASLILAMCCSSFAFAQTDNKQNTLSTDIPTSSSTLNEDPFGPGPEPEPVPVVPQGHVQITAQNFGGEFGTMQYKKEGATDFITINASSLDLDLTTESGPVTIYLKVAPSGNNIINKEATKVSDGNNFIDIDYEKLKTGEFNFSCDPAATNGQSASLAITKTRQIAITLTEASKQMLTNQITLIAGYGDRNDVTVSTPNLSNTIYVDEGTSNKLVLSFAIKNLTYFIPSVTVNGQVYQTTDTGMVDEEENIIICATLNGAAAAASSFQVDLSIFAQLTCTSSSTTMEIVEDATKYELMKDGEIVNEGNFALNGADTDADAAVNDALATYDLSLTKDGAEAHEITDGIEIHLLLDNTVFTGEDYKVVRNHDGVIEALDTMCEVVHDPSTGQVKGVDVGFTTDKFSNYSIVEGDWELAETTGTTEDGATNTGDTLPVLPLTVFASLGIVGACIIVRKVSKGF
ncbi:MAG: hypothetical protein MJ189_00270 [Coriobacteriales bacterium]|nr:hypothetical protein [Coriobacteriales bacterium]